MIRSAIHYGLQPALLIAALGLGVTLENEIAYPAVLFGTLGLLGVLELSMPARPDWLPSRRERLETLAIVVVILAIGAVLTFAYQERLGPALAGFRAANGLDVWPHHWPLVVQVLFAFFASELGWYWLHRAEHRFPFFWRASGHGAHHSFQHLGALHFSANHPFEMFVLLLPMALLELLFGAGAAAAGASVLLLANTALAHANLDLNSRGIDWLFTTNRHHIHHHSRVYRECNTNYGCAAMLWDRVFGTFEDGETAAAGIGPSEPGLLAKAMLPFREPADMAVAPGPTASSS